jgi:hypothetical protein
MNEINALMLKNNFFVAGRRWLGKSIQIENPNKTFWNFD